MPRGNAKTGALNAWEADKIRKGVDAKMKGYIAVKPPSLDGLRFDLLPERGPDDDYDMLTPLILQSICETMVKHVCAVEAAAQTCGIPPELAREYHKKGCDDLRSGRWTRMAHYAMMVNGAEGRVKLALLAGVRENPLGWLNSAWLLERQWPQGYSTQNRGEAKDDANAALAALMKSLSAGREEGAPLPTFNPEEIIDVKKSVYDEDADVIDVSEV